MAATTERWQQWQRDGSYSGEMAAVAEIWQLRQACGEMKIRVATQIRGTNPSVLGEKTRFEDSELISRVI